MDPEAEQALTLYLEWPWWVPRTGRGWFLVWAPAQGLSELSRAQALPQLSVLYNSDILGLSLAWINPAAPFFHFKLDDFEKVP